MLDFLGQSEAVGAWNLLGDNKEKVVRSYSTAMDYSSAYVDTSLDLNSKPLRLLDDAPVGVCQVYICICMVLCVVWHGHKLYDFLFQLKILLNFFWNFVSEERGGKQICRLRNEAFG